MMLIYIDTDFRCHTTPGDGLRPMETEAFDGKCSEYINGFRYIPDGETWTRPDGVVFTGTMIAPATDYNRLAELQAVYEEAQNPDFAEALKILGVIE